MNMRFKFSELVAVFSNN